VFLFFFASWPIIDAARISLPTVVASLISGAR
jgi:hypothetical protein